MIACTFLGVKRQGWSLGHCLYSSRGKTPLCDCMYFAQGETPLGNCLYFAWGKTPLGDCLKENNSIFFLLSCTSLGVKCDGFFILVLNVAIHGLTLNWTRIERRWPIGARLKYMSKAKKMVKDWQMGIGGLVMNWRIGQGLVGCSGIGCYLAPECNCSSRIGLTLNWQIGLGLPMDW